MNDDNIIFYKKSKAKQWIDGWKLKFEKTNENLWYDLEIDETKWL